MGFLGAIGGAVGGLAGALGGKSGGQNAGNIYDNGGSSQMAMDNIQRGLGGAQQGRDEQTINDYSTVIGGNQMLSGIFGKGGVQDQAQSQLSGLYNDQGLTSDDKTAYGQASGDIARQFGQSEQSLSQSLSDRGLSSSGAAGAAFSGLQGNKNEQLAGLQTQIAQKREALNQQKMQTMQNFVGQLGQQSQGAIQQQYDQNMGKNQDARAQAQLGMQYLGADQDQHNEALQQQQQTAQANPASQGLSGMFSGMGAGMSVAQGLSGMGLQNAQTNYLNKQSGGMS